MNFRKKHGYLIASAAIVALAAFLRFHNLSGSGFKFTDEGYHFYPAVDLFKALDSGVPCHLNLYHGLMFWVCLGCSFLGFTYNGALFWGALCGTAAVLLLHLFASRLFSRRTAVFCAFAMAVNYYLIFYARTALSTGHAVFFICWFLVVFDWASHSCGIYPASAPSAETGAGRFLPIVAAGVFLGMLTHIRIELGFIGLGFVGAMGLAFALEHAADGIWRSRRAILASWTPLIAMIPVAILVYVGFVAFLNHLGWVDWDNSLAFYKGHLGFAAGSDAPWKPYVATIIWRLSGIPFLAIALFGVGVETLNFKNLAVRRRWFLISFWGLSLFLLKTGLPYPRTYVYTILFLCVYWGLGARKMSSFFAKRGGARRLAAGIAAALALATLRGELRLVTPLFHKKSRYDQAERFIAERGPGHIYCTHSWPIFELLPFRYTRYLVYDAYGHFPDYENFCLALKYAYEKQNVKYMVLDNNLSYYGGCTAMIQQFAATVLPDAVFRNDYGDDWHVCMDAFGKPPVRDMFTNRIMVYDLRNFAGIPRIPVPYLGEGKMDEVFSRGWEERIRRGRGGGSF